MYNHVYTHTGYLCIHILHYVYYILYIRWHSRVFGLGGGGGGGWGGDTAACMYVGARSKRVKRAHSLYFINPYSTSINLQQVI